MNLAQHAEAQNLSIRASRAEHGSAEQISLFSQSADLEILVLNDISLENRRTYSIIGVSAVALLWKARRLPECKTLGERLLQFEHLKQFARKEILEILALT